MKKMTKIIPIVMIVIISIMTLLFMDFKEANNYLKLENFEIETMSIKYDNDTQNLIDIVEMIQPIAIKNNVILAKANVDSKKENGTNVYLSLKTINDLNEFLIKNFRIKTFNKEKTKASFISTYNQSDDKQIGIMNDLFGNHFYTYYLMDEMIEKNESLFGDYYIYYNEFKDYSNFMNEVNEIMGYNMHSTSYFADVENYIFILIILSSLFLLFFYFIFQVYEYYNNSKKIGCMRIMGFDTKVINKNMIYKNLIIYSISSIVILILAIIFVKNITLYHLLLMIIVNLLIIIFTYYFSYLSCKTINKNYKTANILKKQKTTLKLSKVSYRFKVIMTIMIICFSVIAFENVGNLYNKLKLYNSSKNLLDYGVIANYDISLPGADDYDKQYNLYLNIVNNMETFYADFYDYSQYTNQDFAREKKEQEKGIFYYINSVDKNYLLKEEIKVYDLNEKEIEIDEIENISFLFPKSKKYLIERFKKYQEKEGFTKSYLELNDRYIFKEYLYDDQKVDLYQIKTKYIDSPILRIVDDTIKYPSFYYSWGISLFGYEMNTGLKIKLVDNDKEKTIELLEKQIDEAGLSNLLTRKNFITYKDYFNDEILTSRLILTFLSLAIIVIITVYILVSLQLLKLYIKSNQQKILVKKLLGFDNNDIFEKLFRKNLINVLIAIFLSLIVLILIKKLSVTFVFIVLIMLVLDFLITLLSTKSIKFTKIYLDLKGGNYD